MAAAAHAELVFDGDVRVSASGGRMGVVAALCAGFVVTNLWVVAKVRRRARAAQAR